MLVFQRIGATALTTLGDLGRIGILQWRLLTVLGAIPRSLRLILRQMYIIGNGSIPLVLVTSVFTGAVATIQAHYQFQDYVPIRFLGTVVAKSVVIELGPVLTALVVGARVGASIVRFRKPKVDTEMPSVISASPIEPNRAAAASAAGVSVAASPACPSVRR